MTKFEKYFQHMEQRKKEQQEAEERWRTVEEDREKLFSSVINPGLEDLSKTIKRFKYDLKDSKDELGTATNTYKIEIVDEYYAGESLYELEVSLNKIMDEDNLDLKLQNYHSDKEVEFIGTSENFTKELFKEKLEEMFISLYDKDTR